MEIELQNPNPIVYIHKDALTDAELLLRHQQELDENVIDPVDSIEGIKLFWDLYYIPI